MSTFFEIAYNIIAPIFLVVGAAVLLDRWLHIDPRPLSQIVIYLFTPFLVLDGIAKSSLTGAETGQIIGVALGISALMALAGWTVARSRVGPAADRRLCAERDAHQRGELRRPT